MPKSRSVSKTGQEGEGDVNEEELGEATLEVTVLEPPFVPEPRALTKDDIRTGLSWLGKTADGEGYSYLKATCTGMKLTEISAITNFKHLQYVNFSDNYLTLKALQVVTELPFLILIRADRNGLTSANLNKHKYLQVIVMNNNELETVEDVFHPELSTLEVGYNKISEIKFNNRMPNMRVLDFRNNLVKNVLNLDFPILDSLFLAGNNIKNLTGIDQCPNLRVLHVRNNPIKYLNGFETNLPKLQYLNLRNCKVDNSRQIKKLKNLTALETLILKNTPYMGGTGTELPPVMEEEEEEEDPELRVEVLATLPRLKRLNKAEITPEERVEANDLMTTWLEEGEKEFEEEVEEENKGGEEEEEN